MKERISIAKEFYNYLFRLAVDSIVRDTNDECERLKVEGFTEEEAAKMVVWGKREE